MSAAKANHMGCPAFASIECQIFPEDTNGYRAAGNKFMGAKNGVPKQAQVFSCEGIRPGVCEIQIFWDSSHRPIPEYSQILWARLPTFGLNISYRFSRQGKIEDAA